MGHEIFPVNTRDYGETINNTQEITNDSREFVRSTSQTQIE